MCFGNPHAGDDAFGSLVAGRLLELSDPRLRVVDLSRESPTALLDHIDPQSNLVIVDAVTGPGISPGQLIDIDWRDQARPNLVHDSALSTHGLSVANQVELADRLGMLPAHVRLIGAGVGDPSIGTMPSRILLAAVEGAVNRIVHLADEGDQPKMAVREQ